MKQPGLISKIFLRAALFLLAAAGSGVIACWFGAGCLAETTTGGSNDVGGICRSHWNVVGTMDYHCSDTGTAVSGELWELSACFDGDLSAGGIGGIVYLFVSHHIQAGAGDLYLGNRRRPGD